jgi:putative transcriptional regulator
MSETPGLISIAQYGKVELRLKEQLDARNMTRYQLARHIDTRFEVINKWYQGRVEKLDLDILARICCVLQCSISDILVYRTAEEQGQP